MVLVTFVPALRLGYVLRQEDTRSIARWTLPMMPIRGTVAIDVRGPEPLMNVTALERLANERGELTLGEAQRYADLVASDEKPLAGTDMDWFPISLWYEFNPRYGSSWPRPRTTERWGDAADDPNVVLSSLGVQVAILTDATPGDGIAPALVNEVAPSQVPGPDLIPYHAGWCSRSCLTRTEPPRVRNCRSRWTSPGSTSGASTDRDRPSSCTR